MKKYLKNMRNEKRQWAEDVKQVELRGGNLSLIVRGYGASVGLIEIVRCGTSIGFLLLSDVGKQLGHKGRE